MQLLPELLEVIIDVAEGAAAALARLTTAFRQMMLLERTVAVEAREASTLLRVSDLGVTRDGTFIRAETTIEASPNSFKFTFNATTWKDGFTSNFSSAFEKPFEGAEAAGSEATTVEGSIEEASTEMNAELATRAESENIALSRGTVDDDAESIASDDDPASVESTLTRFQRGKYNFNGLLSQRVPTWEETEGGESKVTENVANKGEETPEDAASKATWASRFKKGFEIFNMVALPLSIAEGPILSSAQEKQQDKITQQEQLSQTMTENANTLIEGLEEEGSILSRQ